MKDNPGLGVGSAATGEQGAAFSSDASTMSNDQLAQKVKAELTKESTGTHDMLASEVARNIKVTANNGVVTLKGSVPTQKDKDIIAIRAQEVKGVTRIDNQLKINPESNPDTRDLTKGHDLDENVQQTQP
jgi:osmotically-inducible protein OsmY